jgi:hypothetical protein
VRAVAAAAALLPGLRAVADDIVLIVRTARGDRLRPADVAASMQLPLAAVVVSEQRLAVATDRAGLGRSPRLDRAAATLLDRRRPAVDSQ